MLTPEGAIWTGDTIGLRNLATWRTLFRILRRPVDASGRGRDSRRRAVFMLWLKVSAAILFSAANLITAWWAATWDAWLWVWGGVLLSVAGAIAVVFPAWLMRDLRFRAGVAMLAEDALRGGPDLPLASQQPPADDTTQVSHSNGAVRVHTPERLFSRAYTFEAAMYTVLAIEWFALNTIGTSHPFSTWQLSLFCAVFLVRGIARFAQTVRCLRPIVVATDDIGVSWRFGRTRHMLAWSEVRGLGLIDFTRMVSTTVPPTGTYPVYLLFGQDHVLAWTSRRRRRLGARVRAGTTAADQDASWLLCSIVAERTGLPLIDVTARATTLVTARTRPSLWRWLWRRVQDLPADSEMHGSVPVDTTTQIGPARPRAAWLAVLLAVVVIIASVGTLLYAPRVYAAALEQAYAHSPLLSDSLSAPSGRWPVGALPSGTFTYAGNAYVVDNPPDACCGAYALAPPVFSDATLEVSVHQRSSFDLSDAGLVVRSDEASSTMLVFSVNPSGEWHFTRYHISSEFHAATHEEELIYEGATTPVGAIHQGSDATNQLAVIMRGSSYAFFINGQFVGIYHDSGPTSGHVGVYTDGLGDSVAFSDLAVYPAPPPSPLLPV